MVSGEHSYETQAFVRKLAYTVAQFVREAFHNSCVKRTCYNNGESVDQISNPPPCVLLKNGVETTAKRHGQLEAVPSESHADSNNQVWSPPGNGPIINREIEGIHVDLILRVVSRLGEPVGVLMPQWLRNSIHEKAHGNTSAVSIKKTEKQISNGTNRSSK
jgi:hypothetical protein